MNADQRLTTPKNKVQELQRVLYTAAKENPKRRFHALYDKVYRKDIMEEAWKRVKTNAGSPGIDKLTIDHIVSEYGEGRFKEETAEMLRSGEYRAKPVRRQEIPKGDGKMRPLGIPTVRDRLVQMAAKLVIEPIFEADFRDCSYGFRPKRSAHG
ncbi:group II intron reverse transcriptase/maturase, partial [Paenibacillus sp. IB182363]